MDRLPKQSKDVKKSSKVTETKKCKTFTDRARRYMPFAVTTSLLAGARVAESLQPENKRLVEPQKTALPEFNPSRVPPGFTDYLRKIGTPESDIRDVQRRVLAEQKRKLIVGNPLNCLDVSASQETLSHQLEQDKGKKQPSSNEKNIANLRTLMEKAKEDPETRQRVRQMLEERKLIVGNPLECLDVSASDVTGSVVSSLPDTGLPGVMEQLTYSLDVRNGCPLPADNVIYEVEQTSTCPPPTVRPLDTRTFTYIGDPFLVGINEHSGMLGPKNTYSGCRNLVGDIPVSSSLPATVTVTVEATGEIPGTVPGTVNLVTSPKKPIIVPIG